MRDPRLDRLAALLRARSIRTGRVVLASGRVSDFYVDARLTTLHPEGAWLVASLVLDRLAPEVVGVGGPIAGADPIVGAVVALSWRRERPLLGFQVRKEPKGHGRGLWIEGRDNLPEGAPVCIVEDTVTTGGSLLRAVERAAGSGLRVVQCIAVVDREEGGADRLAEAGLRLDALLRRRDLLPEPGGSP